jgi:hypothetical protein
MPSITAIDGLRSSSIACVSRKPCSMPTPVAFCNRAQVDARREARPPVGARRAAQQEHPDPVVGADPTQRVGELVEQRAVQRVEPLGTLHREHGDAGLRGLAPQNFVGHCVPLGDRRARTCAPRVANENKPFRAPKSSCISIATAAFAAPVGDEARSASTPSVRVEGS